MTFEKNNGGSVIFQRGSQRTAAAREEKPCSQFPCPLSRMARLFISWQSRPTAGGDDVSTAEQESSASGPAVQLCVWTGRLGCHFVVLCGPARLDNGWLRWKIWARHRVKGQETETLVFYIACSCHLGRWPSEDTQINLTSAAGASLLLHCNPSGRRPLELRDG